MTNLLEMIADVTRHEGHESRKKIGIEDVDFANYRPNFRTIAIDKPIKEICLLSESQKELELFINIPYFLHRHSFDFTDCIGLARIFYAYHGWSLNIEDCYSQDKQGFWKCNYLRMVRYIRDNFTQTRKIEELEYGDLLIFGQRHAMIYLKKGLLLGQGGLFGHGYAEIASSSKIYKADLSEAPAWIGYKRKEYCMPYQLTKQEWSLVQINQMYNPYLHKPDGDIIHELEDIRQTQIEILTYRGYSFHDACKLSDESYHISTNGFWDSDREKRAL